MIRDNFFFFHLFKIFKLIYCKYSKLDVRCRSQSLKNRQYIPTHTSHYYIARQADRQIGIQVVDRHIGRQVDNYSTIKHSGFCFCFSVGWFLASVGGFQNFCLIFGRMIEWHWERSISIVEISMKSCSRHAIPIMVFKWHGF